MTRLEERIAECDMMIGLSTGMERECYRYERMGLRGSRPLFRPRTKATIYAYQLGLSDRATLLKLEE